ncbi:hypothetical protein B0H17DRAFT_1092858 [Mycena rosella]|uniref:Uncharacterized protein n=1 Tax=Mycena rosella TaxID=1033263 RepID=A0AAD7CXL4_MYCRO|nr:hypothetical protein B0H17DRAFT_1092858 [Mycena rosella]
MCAFLLFYQVFLLLLFFFLWAWDAPYVRRVRGARRNLRRCGGVVVREELERTPCSVAGVGACTGGCAVFSSTSRLKGAAPLRDVSAAHPRPRCRDMPPSG